MKQISSSNIQRVSLLLIHSGLILSEVPSKVVLCFLVHVVCKFVVVWGESVFALCPVIFIF